MSDVAAASAPKRKSSWWMRLVPWAITIACFALLYGRIDGAARRQGSSAMPYLMQVFEKVDWWSWLALMIPYSAFFFLIVNISKLPFSAGLGLIDGRSLLLDAALAVFVVPGALLGKWAVNRIDQRLFEQHYLGNIRPRTTNRSRRWWWRSDCG